MTTLGRLRGFNTVAALMGILAFFAAEPRPLLMMAGIVIATLSTMMHRRPAPIVLPRLALNLLVLGATGQVVLQMMAQRQEVITDLTEYIGWVLVIKLLDRKSVRDEAQLLGLSAFAVIGAVLTSNALPLGVVLLLYTPVVIACMMMLQLAAGSERVHRLALAPLPNRYDTRSTGSELPILTTERARVSLKRMTRLAAALSVVLALCLFILIPRSLMRDIFGGWGAVGSSSQVDFNDKIELGSAGLLQTSGDPVMEIRLTDADGVALSDQTRTLYLRGAVLTLYDPDTGQWNKKDDHNQSRRRGARGRQGPPPPMPLPGEAPAPPASDSAAATPPPPNPGDGEQAENAIRRDVRSGIAANFEEPRSGTTIIRQEISLRRPLDGNTPLFALFRPKTVQTDRPSSITLGLSTGLLKRTGSGAVLNYTVVSVLDAVEPTFINMDTTNIYIPADPIAREPFTAGRLHDLAMQIVRQNGIALTMERREPGDNRRLIAAFTDYLRANCAYSLEMIAREPGVDAIESFVFNSKRGHCEYFASALAAMCLAADIPARVITGYAGGEYNGVAGTYTIRKSDAHAWVEARPSPRRWETFDPTPPADLPHARRAGGGILSWLRHLYEAVEFSWIENVVTFDQSRSAGGRGWLQFDATGLRDRLFGWMRNVTGAIPHQGIGLIVTIAMSVAIVDAALIALIWVGRKMLRLVRKHLGAAPNAPAKLGPLITNDTRFYAEMLALLAAAGEPKPAHTPPLHYARGLHERDETVSAIIDELGRLYYRLRFAGEAPTVSARADADAALARLKAHLRDKTLGKPTARGLVR